MKDRLANLVNTHLHNILTGDTTTLDEALAGKNVVLTAELLAPVLQLTKMAALFVQEALRASLLEAHLKPYSGIARANEYERIDAVYQAVKKPVN